MNDPRSSSPALTPTVGGIPVRVAHTQSWRRGGGQWPLRHEVQRKETRMSMSKIIKKTAARKSPVKKSAPVAKKHKATPDSGTNPPSPPKPDSVLSSPLVLGKTVLTAQPKWLAPQPAWNLEAQAAAVNRQVGEHGNGHRQGRAPGEGQDRKGEEVTSDDQAIELLLERAKMADSALRRVALYESGVQLDTKLGQYFVRALEGRPTWKDRIPTAEEIRDTAEIYDIPLRVQESE